MKNITLKEDRTISTGERVEVYYNIQKGGFSIKSLDKQNKDKGKVVAYADNVLIENATFHINEKKLKEIHQRQRKTVYAVIRGYLKDTDKHNQEEFNKGYCNPFKVGNFIDWHTKDVLSRASQVYFYDKFFGYVQ